MGTNYLDDMVEIHGQEPKEVVMRGVVRCWELESGRDEWGKEVDGEGK